MSFGIIVIKTMAIFYYMCSKEEGATMRKFLLGTDWWTDCDDVMAAKIIAKAVTEKKIKLLGVGINACMQYSAASLINYLKYCGLSDVPVGIDREAVDFGGAPPYQKHLAEEGGGKPF